MDIGTVIMNKRKALGYTQQALADKLNVSFQAVSKWENGTNYPKTDMLPLIAGVLETSIDSLFKAAGKTAKSYWILAVERERTLFFLQETAIW